MILLKSGRSQTDEKIERNPILTGKDRLEDSDGRGGPGLVTKILQNHHRRRPAYALAAVAAPFGKIPRPK